MGVDAVALVEGAAAAAALAGELAGGGEAEPAGPEHAESNATATSTFTVVVTVVVTVTVARRARSLLLRGNPTVGWLQPARC